MTTDAATVTVLVDVWRVWPHNPHMVTFAGEAVAWRPAMGLIPVLESNVTVVQGGFQRRGGGPKRPRLTADPGTVLRIAGVPAGHPDLNRPGVTIVEVEVPRRRPAEVAPQSG